MFIDLAKCILQISVIIIFAPLVNGIIRKIKAKVQHRKGAPVFQMYYDLLKLFKKDVVIPENSSWIFWITPYVYFISIIIAALFVPVIPQMFSFGFTGDMVLFVYLLAIGRLFMVLAGLDTGSTFGGMGSSREMMISSLIEPSLLITLFTLGLNPNNYSANFKAIYAGSINVGAGIFSPAYMLLLAAMLIVLIAETARIPVDDPATHLELTMVHEAMILEYSGRYLALMQISASIKQLLLITLVVNVFFPFSIEAEPIIGLFITLILYVLKVVLTTALIAFVEINSVKLRLFSVPNYAALAFILSLLGFMASFVFGR
ncbi:MAG: NADH-quinone oxidoreductase subunit H [Clostridia bacterium]|nr:NADH-quinone oxidoreductase subunit H [Clostridia bacterium]